MWTKIQKQKPTQQIPRKEFLKMTGLGVLGGSILQSGLASNIKTNILASEPAKIGLQLYTVRNQIKNNIQDTLHRVAEVGFEAVETAFWPENISIKEAGKYLKDAGLAVSSAHVELPIADKKSTMLEIAEAFNCTKMIWHGWPEDKRYSTLEGTKQLADIYNEANHFAKSNGLQFGLHNHWWEFRNHVDGRYVYQVLLESVEPDIFLRSIRIG